MSINNLNISDPSVIAHIESGMGLGNQLWNICSTASIAKSLGVPHYILGKDNFKGSNFINIKSQCLNEEEIPHCRVVHEHVRYFKKENFFASAYDENLYLKLTTPCIYKGLFEDERYLTGSISDYIEIDPRSHLVKSVASKLKKTLVVNVRGGEFKTNFQRRPCTKFWRNSIKTLLAVYDLDSVICVTDDKVYAASLFKFDEIISGSVAECFFYLVSAKYLLVSNSSFSYFPIRIGQELGIKKVVHGPFNWARPNNINYHWVSPANFYRKYQYNSIDGRIVSNETVRKKFEESESYFWKGSPVFVVREDLTGFEFKKLIPKSIKSWLRKLTVW